MGEEAQGNKSNLFVENLWWIGPGFGTFFVVCGILVFGGGGGEATATSMNLADDRVGRVQSSPPPDFASAGYGDVEPSSPAGLPPGIIPKIVDGEQVLCGELGTDWGTSWNIYYALKMAGILTDKPDAFLVDRDGENGSGPYEVRNWGLDPKNFNEPVGALSCMPLPIE